MNSSVMRAILQYMKSLQFITLTKNNIFCMCISNKNVVFSTIPLLFRGFVIYLEYNYFYLCKDEIKMAVTYTKLWHILIDKGMKKKDLQQAADLTNHTMLKLRNNENITTETIGKICKALDCRADDIMEFFEEV